MFGELHHFVSLWLLCYLLANILSLKVSQARVLHSRSVGTDFFKRADGCVSMTPAQQHDHRRNNLDNIADLMPLDFSVTT